jgi:putative membrane-bound dehydrogenase-like protein
MILKQWLSGSVAGLFLLGAASRAAAATAPAPQEALKTFTLPPGFTLEVVASEPELGQPVYLTFDERGRMWVVQYLQYPFPAGLKVVGHDEYWRVKFDRFPPPAPPNHVRGADKVTIFEDRDGDGRFETHKDFLTGLNICTAALPGRGGVWVLNPPYLLFYPDANADDVPDGEPMVHLAGFGMEDMHAVANSLAWGPDGWLYGLQGSTCTATIKRPGIDEQGLHFKGQCVWRYQPETRRFELFAEGGFNNFGLAVDRKGRMFTGTNGGKIGVHYVQGGYYQKTWGKHGPLTNPYAFGYFDAMTDESSRAKLSQAMLWYEDGPFPVEFHGKLLVARVLQERIDLCELRPEGSTYSAHELKAICSSTDKYFRPVDLKEGPDGCVYIADWHEANVTWNVTAEGEGVARGTGRIYRLRYAETPRPPAFDYSAWPSEKLVALLGHTNQWHRQMAQRLLTDRRDRSLIPRLTDMVQSGTGQTALEALWAVHACGGFSPEFALKQLGHRDPFVRLSTIRLLGDQGGATGAQAERLAALARDEPDPQVRSQLACTAKRLPTVQALPVVRLLAARSEDAKDPHLPLLVWWAIEAKLRTDPETVLKWLEEPALWNTPLFRSTVASRLGQRFTTERAPENLKICARLLGLAPDAEAIQALIKGMERGLSGNQVREVPAELEARVNELWRQRQPDGEMVRFAVRLGNKDAMPVALEAIADDATPEGQRIELLRMMAERGEASAVETLLKLLREARSTTLRAESLGALQRFGDERIARVILELLPRMDQAMRDKALTVLVSRPSWVGLLLGAVERGEVNPKQVAPDIVLTMQSTGGAGVKERVTRHWGSVRRSPEELRQRMAVVSKLLAAGHGNAAAGKATFELTCAKCHVLFGEGRKVGPELTGVERDDPERLVQAIVDPSSTILPEFTPFQFTLRGKGGGDGEDQVITGFVVEENANSLTIVDTAGNQTTVPRQEIAQRQTLTVSIMPEGLLDAFNDQQIRDLFAYVQSKTPVKTRP